MTITKSNIDNIISQLNNVVINKSIMHYSGWDKQVDPFSLTDGHNRMKYRKERPYNVIDNYFIKIDKENNFIRLRSMVFEVDDFDGCRDYQNVVINIGDDVIINDDVIIIIDNTHFLRKLNQGRIFDVFKLL